MFYHVKELQFKARVSRPDPRFARLLLEQFGGGNGELKSAMQYFVQAFACRNPHPDKYDLLMDIATEEFSHLEIVGATITMLLSGVNGELKNAAETMPIADLLDGKEARDNYIDQAFYFPQFNILTGGGPCVTDSNGVPWSGSYVNANGNLAADLRSNIGGEARAKIVYEYLMKFTDDPAVRDTLGFLMTREITHLQQFEAALETLSPSFPPGVLQQDERFGNLYFDLSEGDVRGPWNEGTSTRMKDQWRYIRKDEVRDFIRNTDGLTGVVPEGTNLSQAELDRLSAELSEQCSAEVAAATDMEDIDWCSYPDPRGKQSYTVADLEEVDVEVRLTEDPGNPRRKTRNGKK